MYLVFEKDKYSSYTNYRLHIVCSTHDKLMEYKAQITAAYEQWQNGEEARKQAINTFNELVVKKIKEMKGISDPKLIDTTELENKLKSAEEDNDLKRYTHYSEELKKITVQNSSVIRGHDYLFRHTVNMYRQDMINLLIGTAEHTAYIKATIHVCPIKYEDLMIIEAESDVILNDIILDGEGDD